VEWVELPNTAGMALMVKNLQRKTPELRAEVRARQRNVGQSGQFVSRLSATIPAKTLSSFLPEENLMLRCNRIRGFTRVSRNIDDKSVN
jgi:hypothetical protein